MKHDDGYTFDTALRIATQAHENQIDKGAVPYIDHALRVAMHVCGDAQRSVAVLHDVLEDTETTESELRAVLPPEVVDAVVALSRLDDEPLDRYCSRVRVNPIALDVKYADIHDNLDPMRMRLLSEQDAVRLRRKYGTALLLLTGASVPDS